MVNRLLKLEEVKEHFEEWRKTRVKRTKIPTHLWQMAINLTKSYSITHIVQTLRLSANALKTQIELLNTNDAVSTEPLHFIQLPRTSPLEENMGNFKIELKRPDGVTMNIQIPSSSLSLLFKTFLKE